MSANRLPHLAQRLFNVPLAIHPAKLEIVVAALADRFGVAKILRPSGQVLAMDEIEVTTPADGEADYRGYQLVRGVAVIPVEGTLVNKLGSLRPYSGMTGYDGIRANLSMALGDPAVRAIVFDMESNGGEVSGCFDLVDAIYQARGEKPMWSILSEHAYSACYALASATDRIVVPRTGGAGSVGVICALAEFSRALDKDGVTVELLTYGSRKADGNPYKSFDKGALQRMQAEVDAMGELFIETVARNRNMEASAVRATQAGTYMGAASVDVGFADAVMAPAEAFRSLLSELG